MNYQNICKDITNLCPNIQATTIIDKADPIAMYMRPLVPVPPDERLRSMFIQTELLVGICLTNEDFFGPLHYMTSRHENLDNFFIPLDDGHKAGKILVFTIAMPYSYEDVIGKVLSYLASVKDGR